MKPIYSVASKLQTREDEAITTMVLKMFFIVAIAIALIFVAFASNPQLAKADSKLLSHLFKNTVRTENVFYQVKIGNDYSCDEKKKLVEVMKHDIYEIDMQSCDIPAPYCGDGIKQEREQCDT